MIKMCYFTFKVRNLTGFTNLVGFQYLPTIGDFYQI